METRLFWERDPGRRVCAYHEGRWRKGSELFHRMGLHMPALWEEV